MNAEQLKTIATHTAREAATILGVHIRTVRYYKQKMEGKSAKQLKEPKTDYKKWTEEEDNYLLSVGFESTYSELQEALKASRTQIDHRCKILGVSPKKLKQRKTLAEEEKKVCLQGCTREVAERLGVSVSTARRRRREILRIDYRYFDARTSVPLPPPSTPTKSLINFVSDKQPHDNDAELFGQSEEQVKERLHHVLREEKNKIGINEIVTKFQGMSAGQIHQMELIYSYCPESAVRYCEVIREYAKNKTAYSPARIRNDR
jgi:transposase